MQVVEQVMRGMRRPDEPYRNHGAATAVRYCSPTNGASSLTPEAFAGYLREPWYPNLPRVRVRVRVRVRARVRVRVRVRVRSPLSPPRPTLNSGTSCCSSGRRWLGLPLEHLTPNPNPEHLTPNPNP